MKIIQIATALTMDPQSGHEMKRTVCVDENGRAWELHGTKWIPLPDLPAPMIPQQGEKK